ncbi:E3 ubiquitin-protein ligase hrd1, partial [Coemansia sp. RSA 486]
MLMYAVESTLKHDATMMVVFAFEYMLLLVRFMSTCARFVLNTVDISRNGEWEEKQSFVFYVELIHDAAKFLIYLGFFCTLTLYYRLPIHILRELYITARSLVDRCRDWIRYRKAMHNMHLRYPTVSQNELDAMNDTTCIICREEMAGPTQEQADLWNSARQEGHAPLLSGDTPKKLPCCHVFHFNCLRNWLERQQSCPTCRQSVLDDTPLPSSPAEQQQQQQIFDNHGAQQAVPNTDGSADTNPVDPDAELQPSSTDNASNEATTELQMAPALNAGLALDEHPAPVPVLPSPSSAPHGGIGSRTARTQQQGIPPLASRPQTNTAPYHPAGPLPLADTLISVFPSGSASMPSLGRLPLLQDFPSPDLSMLSDEHIRRLESDSRTAVSERIRILSALQVQLSHMVVALTQVESLMPTSSVPVP